MPRLPEIKDRDALPESHRDLYDYLASTRGSVRMPFSIILNSPEACRRISHLGTYLRFESSISNAATELATLTVAREFDCRWEWAQHSLLARQAGVSDAALDAVGARREVDELSREEALPVKYARELLHDHQASDGTFAAVVEMYGTQGAVDLTATIGYYAMMAQLLNALEVIPPAEAIQLPA